MGPAAAFLLVASQAAAFLMAPRAPLGCRHTRCSVRLQADGSIADSRRAFLAQQRPTSGTEAFANTQWSLLLKMKGGGGTMFSVELREDMCCRFSDNDETGDAASFRGQRTIKAAVTITDIPLRPLTGSWEAKEEWVVIEKPKGEQAHSPTKPFRRRGDARLQPRTTDLREPVF